MFKQNKKGEGRLLVGVLAFLFVTALTLTGCKKRSAEYTKAENPKRESTQAKSPAKATNETVTTTVESTTASKTSLSDIITAAKTWGPAFTSWYGKEAPDFTLTDTKGKEHKLSDYRGKNVIVIFWATWCGPCRVEIPHLIELRKTIGEDKLAMLAISNERLDLVKGFAEQQKINYTALLNPRGLPRPYSSINAIPSSFFIDSEGKIKLATTGLISLREIRAILKAE